jgi:hypothetical protein
MAGTEGWIRRIDLPSAEAKKVAEWLDKILPELVVQAKSGAFYRIDVAAME